MAKKQTGVLSEAIGNRGEAIFELAITDYSQFARPLFDVAFLGDKWPALDYLVELRGARSLTPVCFVQVKSTAAAIVNNCLSVQLIRGKARLLARVPGPTYLIGVHEPTKRAFIRAVNAAQQGVYKIPVANELTPANLRVLYDEVKAFWKAQDRKPTQSAFA